MPWKQMLVLESPNDISGLVLFEWTKSRVGDIPNPKSDQLGVIVPPMPAQ